MNRSLLHVLLLTTFVVLASACASPFYIVQSTAFFEDIPDQPASIVETADYVRAVGKIKVLAIKEPDGCANESATESSGVAISRGEILGTTCGVEMSEVERTLAKHGYGVISWKVLRNAVKSNESTPIEAAKALGAQALLEINSLERSRRIVGQKARWERRFFRATRNGRNLGPVAVNEHRASLLEAHVALYETELVEARRRPSITINASVTSTKTGRAIWFYEWTRSSDQKGELETEVFTQCSDSKCIVRRQPRKRPHIDRSAVATRAGGSSEISFQEEASDRSLAEHHDLMRALIDDLVTQFEDPGT